MLWGGTVPEFHLPPEHCVGATARVKAQEICVATGRAERDQSKGCGPRSGTCGSPSPGACQPPPCQRYLV